MNKEQIEKILGMNLFKELNLEDVEPEIKQTILDDATYVISRGIWIKIIENLSEEKQNQLAEMLQKEPNNAEIVTEFIKKNYQIMKTL